MSYDYEGARRMERRMECKREIEEGEKLLKQRQEERERLEADRILKQKQDEKKLEETEQLLKQEKKKRNETEQLLKQEKKKLEEIEQLLKQEKKKLEETEQLLKQEKKKREDIEQLLIQKQEEKNDGNSNNQLNEKKVLIKTETTSKSPIVTSTSLMLQCRGITRRNERCKQINGGVKQNIFCLDNSVNRNGFCRDHVNLYIKEGYYDDNGRYRHPSDFSEIELEQLLRQKREEKEREEAEQLLKQKQEKEKQEEAEQLLKQKQEKEKAEQLLKQKQEKEKAEQLLKQKQEKERQEASEQLLKQKQEKEKQEKAEQKKKLDEKKNEQQQTEEQEINIILDSISKDEDHITQWILDNKPELDNDQIMLERSKPKVRREFARFEFDRNRCVNDLNIRFNNLILSRLPSVPSGGNNQQGRKNNAVDNKVENQQERKNNAVDNKTENQLNRREEEKSAIIKTENNNETNKKLLKKAYSERLVELQDFINHEPILGKFLTNLANVYGDTEIPIQNFNSVVNKLRNYNIESSSGHIMVGNRYTDEDNSFFFIERTALNDPQQRLKQWNNRQGKYTYKVKDHIFTEKLLHEIFDFTRTKRVSEENEKHFEIEWFKFKEQLSYEQINKLCIATIECINSMYDEKHKKYEKVNLNTASKSELMSLKQIGEVRASRIIEHRQSHQFDTIEDIMNIKSIKQGIFNTVKDLICV